MHWPISDVVRIKTLKQSPRSKSDYQVGLWSKGDSYPGTQNDTDTNGAVHSKLSFIWLCDAYIYSIYSRVKQK